MNQAPARILASALGLGTIVYLSAYIKNDINLNVQPMNIKGSYFLLVKIYLLYIVIKMSNEILDDT